MSKTWVPPGRIYHLRIFAICLVIVTASLLTLLFAVHMEALAPVSGLVTARDLQEVRTVLGGLIEPGWYTGSIETSSGLTEIRLDSQGNGMMAPVAGGKPIRNYRTPGGRLIEANKLRFHELEVGDELWPGQVLGEVRADAIRFRLRELESQADQSGPQPPERVHEKAWLEQQLREAVLHVPAAHQLWQAITVRVEHLQAVQPGEAVATIVPIDPKSKQPVELLARLDVAEKNAGELQPGQEVRLHSNMFNHRLHGRVQAKVERVEPWGEDDADGKRIFHATAAITEAPFRLPLGSTFKGEVIVGRKSIYRIILEH
ncbi:MAG: HlyD family efflux transporter periplasmic adaptor subunit [Gemmataceae bacterium]